MEERRHRSGNTLRITWNIQTERTQMLLETRHVLDRPQAQDRQTHRGFFPAANLSLYEKSLDKSVGIAYVSIASGGWRRFVSTIQSTRIFYGWWIVVAAFLNLFFAVGIIFYGFPVFYPALADSLGFGRAQLTQGFLLGFLVAGLPFGLVAGTVIDRIGARWVILAGVGLIGVSLMLMGSMTKLWHYEVLCIIEVLGYVLAGPIGNQVLVARWFQLRRGRAMGYAYLGLGLARIIHDFRSAKGLAVVQIRCLCGFETKSEAFACPNIPQQTVSFFQIFLIDRRSRSLINYMAVPMAERFCCRPVSDV